MILYTHSYTGTWKWVELSPEKFGSSSGSHGGWEPDLRSRASHEWLCYEPEGIKRPRGVD